MKHAASTLIAAALSTVLVVIYSCGTTDETDERIARQYCGSCHVFPEPGLLDKKTWATGVLPEMAYRMGIDKSRPPIVVNGRILETVPATAMVTGEEWEAIKKYFQTHAPEKLALPPAPVTLPLSQFNVSTVSMRQDPQICLVKIDTVRHRLYAGNKAGEFIEYNTAFARERTFQLPSPPSSVIALPENKLLISAIGIIEPNDETKGAVILLEEELGRAANVLDSLKRPVNFEYADLNGDGREDYAVCEFGNFSGAFRIYENTGTWKYKPHTILGLPGARKVVIRDVNKDRLPDLYVLFTQADEKIVLFMNKGNFQFERETLLRFPSVYGSSFFDLVDFNHDGAEDILYTNGDNYDYSSILKPYHGVHIFLNDRRGTFKESWFHPLYGASMAVARDYDGDGDVDVAAISFFSDYQAHPENSFMYFENKGTDFAVHVTPFGRKGQWLVMDTGDVDNDGDDDIVLGAFNVNPPQNLAAEWSREKTALLLLLNNSIQD